MKREREENDHQTSPSPTQRLRCRKVSTGENPNNINIPLDLAVEILKKLPAKSLVRFRCVSKQWSLIISYRRDFIDSIVTRSLTQPPPRVTHLICYMYAETYSNNINIFLSSTYHTDKESVLIPGESHQYLRGLICGWSNSPSKVILYNPTTRQSLLLPEIQHKSIRTCFLGYDPLENQYKILCIQQGHYIYMEQHHFEVFTVGDSTAKDWRNIRCSIGRHFHLPYPTCINGAIYYRATYKEKYDTKLFLVSFHVRSEKFSRVEAPKPLVNHYTDQVINYQGKLGFMCCRNIMEIWVMEKRQEWTKMFSYEMEGFDNWRMSGVTCGGEIVFVKWVWLSTDKRLYFLYYDPKRNYMRYFDIEGATYPQEIWRNTTVVMRIIPDHVENTMRLY